MIWKIFPFQILTLATLTISTPVWSMNMKGYSSLHDNHFADITIVTNLSYSNPPSTPYKTLVVSMQESPELKELTVTFNELKARKAVNSYTPRGDF